MSRLEKGGAIERTRPISFTFDSRRLTGYQGDTLASALLANDVRLVGRSFKYHRPRGVFSAGSEEPNALVELRKGSRREPNTRATTVELFDGLSARSQNNWPTLGFDLLAVNNIVSPMLAAGFYYKTFMWPAAAWERLYEPLIRRAAGLGRASLDPDPDHYEKCSAFCDVLVIGGGPAGLTAALQAARSRARVILVDEDFAIGGKLLSHTYEINGRPAVDFVQNILTELTALPNVRIFRRTTVFGIYDSGVYGAVERVSDHLEVPRDFQPRQRLWKIVAKRAILATGALDRPIAFGGNDRPGIMSAEAVQTYMHRFAVAPASRLAVFTNNDSAWQAAFDATELGLETAAIIDVRDQVDDGLVARAKASKIRTILGGQVIGTSGKELRSIKIRTRNGQERLNVDGLAVSGGHSPNVHLTCHHGGRPVWNEQIAAFVPDAVPPNVRVAGAAAGEFDLKGCIAGGARSALESVESLGLSAPPLEPPEVTDRKHSIQSFWHVKDSQGSAFVDFQNDVTIKDIEVAHREGFRSVEHLKRYTTLGMATDQGKTSNVVGLAVMASLIGQDIPSTGTTIFRPPYTPVAIGALAGHHVGKDFRPTRPTPTHLWAKRHGAQFIETGLWLRAQYFPKAGENDWLQTVNREVASVRSGVGMIDVSTFGKIDLQGADVGTFLDRVYINMFSTLGVGKARYGVMLREDGIVLDDGTAARLGPKHYALTTTTVNALRVYQHLEFCLQVLWPNLDVRLSSTSEHWAQIALAGPKSREVLAAVVDADVDVSNEALPYMSFIEASVLGGLKARIFRLSFSGELGYEIALPSKFADRLATALMEAGQPLGITPYGLEALSVMRIEKGHVSGPELNGQTTAADIGLGRMASTKKDYIGRVMAERAAFTDPDRPSLAGFKPVDGTSRLRAGAHFIGVGARGTLDQDEGYLTSVAFSPSLGSWIGLGFIKGGQGRIGERVRAFDPIRSGDVEVEICSPVFVDLKGERLRV